MIIIGGTKLSLEDLPFSDVMEYTIEENQQILGIKLKTVAKGSSCLGVYLHTDLKDIELSEDVQEKTTYFNDDDHLKRLLDSGGKEIELKDTFEADLEEIQKTEEEVKVFSSPTATPPKVEVPEPPPVVQAPLGNFVIEEADTDIPESLLEIPNINEDIDSLHQQLENKQRIINQKDGQILDMEKNMDELYKLQEIQLLEMREVYEKRIDEANDIIDSLKKKVEQVSVPEELQWFLKYATYSQNYKAALKEGFTQDEVDAIGKITSPIHIFASGAGDSLHSMMKNIKMLMDARPNAIFVDFSNDYFMNARYRIQTRDSSLVLNNPEVEVEALVKDVNGTALIPTTFYNDIALLGVDWVSVIKKLLIYAKGRPIFFIFNSINSFNVRYTVSKLATIGELYIFAKSNPVILSTLFGDIAFIPEGRFKIVAMDYIDVVQGVLEQISKRHQVTAFKDKINWTKMGIKLK